MAIPVSKIKEHCCDNDLSQFNIIDGDSLDSIGSTCDIIIECHDKYILVEEKSIIFDFLNSCCNENNINLDNEYKPTRSGIQYLEVSRIINEIVQPMPNDIKTRILSFTVVNMICDSAKKASNTTDILNKQFDSNRTNDMKVLYLYCNSGKPIDRIMATWLSSYKKAIFIECNALKQHLIQRPCQ